MLRRQPSALTACLLWAFAALALGCSQPGGTPETDRFGKALLQVEREDPYGLRVPPEDARRKAIEELTSIGSVEAVRVLEAFLTTYGAKRKLKQEALAALGKIGSPDAVAAIGRFEAWAERVRLRPPGFRFGRRDYAIDHFQQHNLQPLATCKDPSGREWAAFRWGRFGDHAWWLTQAQGEGRWSPPILLDLLEGPEPYPEMKFGLETQGDAFLLKVDRRSLPFSLRQQQRDSDGDGLTDAVERLLLTDPGRRDTDKDGVPDGRDGNPLTPKHKVAGPTAEIRQAVFSALFATCASQDAIVMVRKGDFADQEYRGYGGVILRSPTIRKGFVNVTGLTVKITSPTTAEGSVEDWEGNLAASGHQAKLKKIQGKWVVVEFGMTWIS